MYKVVTKRFLNDAKSILNGMGVEPETMLACGGGGKSPLWRQMLADVMNCPVATTVNTEGPALECSAFGEIVARQFCQFLAILVENGRRTLVIDIVIDAVEGGLDGVGRELAIRYFVVGLQQVKRRGRVIDLVGLLRCRGASSNNQGCRCDKGKTNEMSEHVELRV